MADDRELRRRAQALIDRPPYEPLPVSEVRRRARVRQRRTRVQIVAGLCVVALGAATVGIVANYGASDDRIAAVRTTNTAAPITAPVDTTIADLRFTPIAGPDGDNRVELYGAGDEFFAVELGDQSVTRAWIGDASGHWRAMKMPAELRRMQIGTVVRLRERVVVVGIDDRGTVVLEGPSLERLRLSPWTAAGASLPAAMHPAPPTGDSIVVSGNADSTAVGENGIVLAGTVSAQLDRALLPESVRNAFVRHLGRIDVVAGRVVAWIYNDTGAKETVFDQPASALGITAAEARYLAGSDESRTEMAVWTAGWGKPLRQGPATGVDTGERYGNFSVTQVSDGFVLTAPTATGSAMWWSPDGRSWQQLATPPGGVVGEGDSLLVELGSRWVVATGGTSDDHGRSWTPIDLSGDVARRAGTGRLFGGRGSSAFGLLAASTPLDAGSLTTFPGRLLYTPDGLQWSSVALDDVLDFTANVPSLAVANRSAILEAGLRAPGAQPQRFWLVTRRP